MVPAGTRIAPLAVLAAITLPAAGWTHVELDDATEGYVSSDSIRNASGHRALFKQRGGKWMMTAFVAGV